MYEDYVVARDAAWKTLIECKVSSLPVDLTVIADFYDIEIVRYSKCRLTQLFNPDAISGDGFITKINDRKYIFLNDHVKTRGRRRFTVGHELGHGVLGHPLNEIVTRNSEVDNEDLPLEVQANVFARDILAPAAVLNALGVNTVKEIADLCDISQQSAQIRLDRLNVLRERGKFGTSPLERTVLAQFSDFIQNNKG